MSIKNTTTVSAELREKLLRDADEIESRDPGLAEGMRDIASGRMISHEDLVKKLHIKRSH